MNSRLERIKAQNYVEPPSSLFDSSMSCIIDSLLFLGAQHNSCEKMLDKNNIQCIVSIGCSPLFGNSHKYILHPFDVNDNGRSTQTLFNDIVPKVHDIINDCIHQKKPLLVHCQAGISRSAICIITWFMKYKQMNYEDAFALVKTRRPTVHPNMHFAEYAKTKFNQVIEPNPFQDETFFKKYQEEAFKRRESSKWSVNCEINKHQAGQCGGTFHDGVFKATYHCNLCGRFGERKDFYS